MLAWEHLPGTGSQAQYPGGPDASLKKGLRITRAMYAVKFPMFQQPHSDYALLRNQLTTICKNQWSVMQDDTGAIVCSVF